MKQRDRVSKAIKRSIELKRDGDNALKGLLRAELAVIRTFCSLAQQHTGARQSHHLAEARKAVNAVIKLAGRLDLSEQERADIEKARRELSDLEKRARAR